MREYAETHRYYTKEDCDALDSMPLRELASVLDGIEGTWMPGRPHEYYELSAGRVEEAELDFGLLKACKAIDCAARIISRLAAEQEKKEKEAAGNA